MRIGRLPIRYAIVKTIEFYQLLHSSLVPALGFVLEDTFYPILCSF
jgi:hypothetical protein